ncbi:hypothetical protein C8R45DRAFT_755793, partial [Mycena sanguinolenta]
AHPQFTTHCMKKLSETEMARVPVLAGIPIPRADREDEKEAHQIAMLVLFQPWSTNLESPLKDMNTDWQGAYKDMMKEASTEHRRIMDNMQLIYKSRDAKHDFSAMRR